MTENHVLFEAEANKIPDYTHVVLITTGSVASVKVPLIVKELLSYKKVRVEVVATEASLTFYKESDIINVGSRVWVDKDEWKTGYKISDPILHIELRRWADIVLIAPCSANTLAKMANGLCDNLATSLLRALSPETPTLVFPAMNTSMFENPLTERHLQTVKEILRYEVIGPIGKRLACGDIGLGAMTEWSDIVKEVVNRFGLVKAEQRSS